MNTIFITIPSYEDPILLSTIESALSQASNPKNIYFAIALQYKKIALPDLSKYYEDPNFDFVTYDVDTRPGVNQVRHNLLKFYKNQDYFMMIDSHTTFMKDWDVELVKDYKKLQDIEKNNKVVLSRQSTSAVGNMCSCDERGTAEFQHCVGHEFITKWHIPEIDERYNDRIIIQSLRADPKIIKDVNVGKDFIKTHYTCCSFLFTNSDYIHEVGICDGLSFLGEEPSQSLRAFYAGWDVFTQTKIAYIQHDSFDYNFELYGSRDPALEKLYARKEDYENCREDSEAMELLFSENAGKYKMLNPVRTPDDFFEEVGLLDELNTYRVQRKEEQDRLLNVHPYAVYMDEYEKVGYSADGILRFKNFIHKDIINQIVAYMDSNEIKGSVTKNNISDKTVVDLILDMEEKLYALVNAEYLDRYDIQIKRKMKMGGIDLMKWKIGDSLSLHSDTENYKREPILNGGWFRSNITVILYLTDEYSGGEICFPEFDLEIKPQAGELFVYPGRYRHKVNKLISGKRYTALGAFEFDVISRLEDIFDPSIENPSAFLFEGYDSENVL